MFLLFSGDEKFVSIDNTQKRKIRGVEWPARSSENAGMQRFTRALILLANKTNSIIIIRFYYKYIYFLSLSLSLLLVFLVILFGLVFFLSHDGVFVH